MFSLTAARSYPYTLSRDTTYFFQLAARSYWVSGSFATSSSMSEPSNALPRFRTL
jgi:hypothetical protein